jgi:GntR family transcriptional regulator/MocR family aminotransferase
MTGARRQAWLNYAQQSDSWLVEDDYDSEFIYSGTPPPPLFNLNHNQHTLFLGTFSKLMFQHFRLGYLVVPESLVALAEAIQMELGAMASVHIQPALASFLADRHFSSHMRKMRKLYQHKGNILAHCINQELRPWLAAKTPTGGMHLLALANTDLNDLAVEQQAQSYGIYCPALSRYFQHTAKPPQGFLLGFSGTTIEQIHSNTGILKQILQSS